MLRLLTHTFCTHIQTPPTMPSSLHTYPALTSCPHSLVLPYCPVLSSCLPFHHGLRLIFSFSPNTQPAVTALIYCINPVGPYTLLSTLNPSSYMCQLHSKTYTAGNRNPCCLYVQRLNCFVRRGNHTFAYISVNPPKRPVTTT